MSETPEARLAKLGIELPVPNAAVGSYLPWVKVGELVYVSGQLPMVDGAIPQGALGLVGGSVSMEQARAAAKQCAINIISQLRIACDNSLQRVERIIKIQGFVASSGDFTEHPKVINAASDLLAEVFGDIGQHCRVAVGSSCLPLGCCVEIDAIAAIR